MTSMENSIMRHLLFRTGLALLLVCGYAQASEAIRIDASSDASAEATWKQMTESTPAEKKRELLVAMLKLNLKALASSASRAKLRG
jgi:hypothetical protein